MKKIRTKVAKKTLLMQHPNADRIYIYLLLNSSPGNWEYRRTKQITIKQIAKMFRICDSEAEEHMNFLKLCARVKKEGKYFKVLQEDYDIIMPPELVDYINTNWTYNLQLIDFYKLIMEYWTRNEIVDTNNICQLLYPYRQGRLSCDDAALIRTAMSFLRQAGFIEYDIVGNRLQDGICITTYKIKWVSPQPVQAGINKDRILKEETAKRIIDAIHKAREQYC